MQVEIQNYPVFVRIGCLDSEINGQNILVSLVAEYNAPPVIDDEKNQSEGLIDYAQICSRLDLLLDNKRVHFVETVVEMIGEDVLNFFSNVKKIEVLVEKLRFPQAVNRGAKISVREVFYRTLKE